MRQTQKRPGKSAFPLNAAMRRGLAVHVPRSAFHAALCIRHWN